MKTIKLFLTTIALLLCSVMANAYDFEVDGMYYNLLSATDLTVEVTAGENEYSGEVIIPSTITYQSRTLAVVGISSRAFGYDSTLTSITIPQSIVSIYDDSFVNCKSLKHLYIENYDGHEYLNRKDIAILVINRRNKSPFCDCPLESIYIGRDFTYRTTTHDPLFYQQTQLKSLTIGESFSEIENDMFNDCSSLEEVYIEDGTYLLYLGYNDEDGSMRGVFFDSPIKSLYLGRTLEYPKDRYNNVSILFLSNSMKTLKSLTIGKFVNKIEQNAFYYCSDSLQMLRIEDGNETLKLSKWSFLGVRSVDSLDCYIGRNLDYVDVTNPFQDMQFKSIILGDSVTSICDYMFDGCCSLIEKITLPNSIVSIGKYAFRYAGLSEITIPNSVTNMGDGAFEWCWKLKSVTLPNSLTSIGNHAFKSCGNLKSITLPNSLTSIGNSAFNSCYDLKNIVIPDGVINIGDYAFGGCGLTSITIPNSVSSLGKRVFSGCDSLTSLYVEKATPITLNEDILYPASAYINTTLYVPAGSLAAYQGAYIWRNFWTIQEYYLDKKFCVNYFVDGELYAVDSVKHGDTIIPRAEPQKENYIFSGWSEVPETMPAHDVEVIGNFIFTSVTDVKVDAKQSWKVIEDNQLFIMLPNGKKYNIMGQKVK